MKRQVYLYLLLALACQRISEPDAQRVAPVFADTVLLNGPSLVCRDAVTQFYDSRDLRLFWSDGVALTPAADSLIAVIEMAQSFGLIPYDYHANDIRSSLDDSARRDHLPLTDIYLTDAFLSLYHHLRNGRLDPVTGKRRDMSQVVDADAMTALAAIHAGSVSDELCAVEPVLPQYRALKKALRVFADDGDSVQRLRARKIAVNMERWRWQAPWPDQYIFVNIPAFTLRVVENDSVWLKTDVIVGKRTTPTPVLESVIRSFIIYPYWHVPRSISTKEILPLLKADAAYLRRNNFDVLDTSGALIDADTIQWNLYSPGRFPFVLRQREGSENSMGIIKFNFANNYNVYLHDTNSKRLFKKASRDFSHGCIRVKEAVSLAHHLVREDDIYVSPQDLDQYLSLQQRLTVKLRKPIVLRMEYFTAEVEDGVPSFYDDIYRKDSVMLRSLYD